MDFFYQNMRARQGFSLIELLVVVSIIGVLVTFAHIKYLAFSAKAKQIEAKQSLSMIYALTTSYLDENPNASFGLPFEPPFYAGGLNGAPCGARNAIGFVLSNCPMTRYYYGLETTGGGGFMAYANSRPQAYVPASEFLPFPDIPARAGILPDWCNKYDVWTIDQNKNLEHPNDAIKECLP